MCFSVRPEKNAPVAQLISQATQIRANNWVGQVAVHPLQTKARNGFNSCIMSSVPVLTFVSCRGAHYYECQNQRDTSNHVISVWLWFRSPHDPTRGTNDADF